MTGSLDVQRSWSANRREANLLKSISVIPISFVDSKPKESRSGDDDRDYLNGKEDIHEADIKFQISVRDFYLKQTQADKDFVKVCCQDTQGNMLPPQQIFKNISTQVESF